MVMVIGDDGGYVSQTILAKAILGALAGLAMNVLIGDFVEPAADLVIDIRQIGEVTQRPEVLANISDSATLHFSFFPRGGYVTGARIKAELAGETQETGIVSDQVAVMFHDGGREIIIGQLARDATERLKGMNMTPGECFKALAMGKLHIHFSTVAFDEREGIELALIALVVE